MDIDSCINTYIDMAPKIFPVEGIMSGSRLGKLLSAARGLQRFNPAPFEAAIKTLIKDHLTARSIAGENTLLRFEAAVEHRCKMYVQHSRCLIHFLQMQLYVRHIRSVEQAFPTSKLRQLMGYNG